MATAGGITPEYKKKMQIQAAKNPGNWSLNQWLYPDLEDMAKGRSTVAQMRKWAEKEAKFTPPPWVDESEVARRQRRENAARDAAAGNKAKTTPTSAVVYAGGGGEESETKAKKKKKTATILTGAQGLLSGVSSYRPSLLGT